MVPSPDKRPPMTVAMEWVSRITALAMAMVLPGLLGYWIDSKIGTRFLGASGICVRDRGRHLVAVGINRCS